MKRANEIINNINNQPHFKSVQNYSCYNKLLELLPPRFKNAIAFFYIKNNTLFGALKHPGYKIELNYNKDLVKALLNQLILLDNNCTNLFKSVKNIKFFISKYYQTPKININTIPYYTELANGEFEIEVKDKDIKNILERIKIAIKKNNEKD